MVDNFNLLKFRLFRRIGCLCAFIANATVNREKGPKMKMAQEVLRHCIALS